MLLYDPIIPIFGYCVYWTAVGLFTNLPVQVFYHAQCQSPLGALQSQSKEDWNLQARLFFFIRTGICLCKHSI